MDLNFKKNIVGVTSSEWYLNKYGSQPAKQEIIATQSHGVYGMNITGNTATYSSDYFINKLAAKGITVSKIQTEALRTMEEIVKPEGKGFTQSFSEIVKMKMSEPLPTYDVMNDFRKMPFMNKNIGMTFSKIDFASKRLGTASDINSKFGAKIDVKSKFGANTNTVKKFYTQVPNDTPQLDNTNFVDFVAKVGNVLADNAKRLIELNKVTVNNNKVTDIDFILNVGDLVRVGLIGHYINNNKGIAIVK